MSAGPPDRQLPDTDTEPFHCWIDWSERIAHFRADGLVDIDTFEHVAVDLVLPRLLSSEGSFVLHGGLIGFGDTFAAFIAPSGFGKSTIVASLSRLSANLISDDAVIVDSVGGGYEAMGLYPSLRLFQDSIGSVLSNVTETSPVAEYTAKRRVPFTSGPSKGRLGAVFRLREPADAIRVQRLREADACMALIANAFAFDPHDVKAGAGRLAVAAEIARIVPVFDLHYPRDYNRLPDVRRAVLNTMETIEPVLCVS